MQLRLAVAHLVAAVAAFLVLNTRTMVEAVADAAAAIPHADSAAAIPRADATDCTADVNVESDNGAVKCRFNVDSFVDMALQSMLQLTVAPGGGRLITCTRSNHKGRYAQADHEWHGDCDGNASDINLIRLNDEDEAGDVDGNDHSPQWFGSIRDGHNICQISPNTLGESEIRCIPASWFVPTQPQHDKEELVPISSNTNHTSSRLRSQRNLHFGYQPSQSRLRRSDSRSRNRNRHLEDGSTIDIMVVWTKAAECSASFLDASSCTPNPTTRANIMGAIQLAVAETNTAFVESGVETQLRLVHAYRDVNYVESTTTTPGYREDLYALHQVGDGQLDTVHEQRALYGADMVALIAAPNPSVCGVGFVGGEAEWMFSVVGHDCLAGTFAFAHEVAHNLGGANHDRGTEDKCGETGTYNYGYRDPDGEFRSIMSYTEITNQCDNIAPNDNFHRAQRFSNPDILYKGKPIGTATENNARALNERKAVVASFFPAMNCESDDECNDNNDATYDWCNMVNAACIFSANPKRVATLWPTKSPTTRPTTKAPTPSPVSAAPTRVPTVAPTETAKLFVPTAPLFVPAAPLFDPDTAGSTFMEAMVVSGVQSDFWTTVYYKESYTLFAPVPVCTVQYDNGTELIPAVVRMTNVGPQSFDIRLQNPSNWTILVPRTVHCLVVGEGAWTMPDGRRVQATRYTSNVTDHQGSWLGEFQPDPYPETDPIVLGQVMSSEDPHWSAFWCSGWSRNYPPSNWTFVAGKHVGKDGNVWRANEQIGYIVIDSGSAYSNGIVVETGRGAEAATGYVMGSTMYALAYNYTAPPAVAIASQAGMRGDMGSWAVLKAGPTATSMAISVDEDQTTDFERYHASEIVDFAVFSSAGSIALSTQQ